MTTPSTERKAGPLLGTGAQTTWPFTFKVFAATDIAVTIATNVGVETQLVYGVDYTVSLNANQETSPGGTVTYPISGTPLPIGYRLVIAGNLPYDQPLDLPSGGNFSPLALENELDRAVMQIQQLRERLSRAVQVRITADADVVLPPPAASQLIGWDTTGENLQNVPLSSLSTNLGFATYRYDTFTGDDVETQYELTADPATLGNLDVAVGGVTQTPGVDYTLVNGVLVFTSAPPNGAVILARYGEGLPAVAEGSALTTSYTPAGVGAIATDVEAKLRESRSVFDFMTAAQVSDVLAGVGSIDVTGVIQAAINATANNGSLLFPPGAYKLTAEVLLNGKAGLTLLGYGATIKGTATRFRSYFNVCGADKIRFFGFEFDLMFGSVQQYVPADYPNLYNVGIFGNGYIGAVGTIEVYHCRFKNLYTDGIFIFNAGRLKVEGCDFTSPAQNQNQIIEHISTGTIGTVEVYRSSFINANPGNSNNGVCGIVMSGVRTRANVEDCDFEYCGRNNAGTHRLAVIDLYYDGNNITIRNNRARNTLGQFMRLSACWNGRIEGNYVHQSGNSETGYTMLSIEGFYSGGPPAATNVGTRNVIVCNNVFDDEFNRQEICVGVFCYDWGLPSRNVQVHNNVILGAKFAVLVSGAFQNVSIKDNDIYGYQALIDVRGNTNAPTITSLYGSQANSAMENLVIQGNSMQTTVESGAYMISVVPGPVAQYQGTINLIKIFDNRIVAGNTVSSGGGGVAINCNQTTKTAYLLIERNTTQNCATDYYIRGAYKLSLTNNVAGGTRVQFYDDDGSNNYVQRRFNQQSVEQHQGTVALVAGVATVTTAEIKTGDRVLVTRVSTGGTPGHLYVDNIVNSISFRINSTSATDTSTVFYEIVH